MRKNAATPATMARATAPTAIPTMAPIGSPVEGWTILVSFVMVSLIEGMLIICGVLFSENRDWETEKLECS